MCKRCQKDIDDGDFVMQEEQRRVGGTSTFAPVYYHKECFEQTQKEIAEAEATKKKADKKKGRIICYAWSSVGAVVGFIIGLVACLSPLGVGPAIGVAFGAAFALFAGVYCVLCASYVSDVFLSRRSGASSFFANGDQEIHRCLREYHDGPIEIEEGKTLARPKDPFKAGSIFVGWFHDASFGKEVVFPLTIKADTAIYANFYSRKHAFEKARNNTIGDNVAGYEYDYKVHAPAKYMNFDLNGNTTENAKYRADKADVAFLDKRVNSGSLFYDGTKHQMKKGMELHKIEQVGEEHKYDASSFAKAVFEYDDKQLKEIKPTAVRNEYELKTSFNWTKALVLVGNYLNHPIVEKVLGSLPETDAETHMYVSFAGDKLLSYRNEVKVNVEAVTFSLTYEMTFKNVGVLPSIVAPVFENTYVGALDVNRIKQEVDTKLDAYKALAHSSYDYRAKTAVDFKGKNAIDATVKGFTKRKADGDKVYYLNDYEIDTDLKNGDLYQDAGLKDVHAARANLRNGEVHDLKKKLTSFGGAYEDVKAVSEDVADRYHLFDVLESTKETTYIQRSPMKKLGR